MLAPYRVLVRPLVGGVSKTMETLGTSPLDDAEKEGGTQAFSAVLHQYGGQLDARVLLALWVVGVTLPRVAEYAEARSKAAQLVKSDAARTVQGKTVDVRPNPAPITSTPEAQP